jgi:hypothetical protein
VDFWAAGTSGSESNLKHDLVSRKVEPGDSTVITQDYLAFHTSVFDVFIYTFLTCLQIRSNGSICEEVEEEGKKSRYRGKAGGTNQYKSSGRKIYFLLRRGTARRRLRARGAGKIFSGRRKKIFIAVKTQQLAYYAINKLCPAIRSNCHRGPISADVA